jgi:hypothetical protein
MRLIVTKRHPLEGHGIDGHEDRALVAILLETLGVQAHLSKQDGRWAEGGRLIALLILVMESSQ